MRQILVAALFFMCLKSIHAQDWYDFPMQHEMTEIWEPEVPVITPGESPGDAPSDAIILFGGKDMSQWDIPAETEWLVDNGVVSISTTDAGYKAPAYISTKRKFGDVQLHIEWRTPFIVAGESQKRGNSGVLFQGLYEIQILDNYHNRTYKNGQCARVYKQYAPLVNVCKAPGEWQVYEIIYTAPRFNADGTFFTPPRVTVIQNGVLVQNNVQVRGPVKYIGIPEYYIKPHGDAPIYLQDHGCAVSFRNIWVREL